MSKTQPKAAKPRAKNYPGLVGDIGALLEQARHSSARAVNALMTATYWEIGRRIVEFEQGGAKRAEYGDELLVNLSRDLTAQFNRGFSRQNLQYMRQFYLAAPAEQIRQTVSSESPTLETAVVVPTQSNPVAVPFALADLARAFPLPWSHYVLLIGRARSPEAFTFYHSEALRGGWSVRQLQRQIDSQFYERTALSRNKAAMLTKGSKSQPGDAVTADDEIRHPLVLEFLNLRDEYSETDLEDSLIRHLETFLLEPGTISPSSAGSDACESTTSGTAWTCSFFIVDCVAWSSWT